MQNTSASALNPGVQKREVFAWSMYDFANSGYTTVVLTAVFNAYFVSVVAQKAELIGIEVGSTGTQGFVAYSSDWPSTV